MLAKRVVLWLRGILKFDPQIILCIESGFDNWDLVSWVSPYTQICKFTSSCIQWYLSKSRVFYKQRKQLSEDLASLFWNLEAKLFEKSGEQKHNELTFWGTKNCQSKLYQTWLNITLGLRHNISTSSL